MKKILSLPIWLHITLSMFTGFLWLIVVLVAALMPNEEVANVTTEKEESPKYSVVFKIAGVTFENRQDTIKQIVNEAKKEMLFEPYDGLTSKEILEDGCEVYEVNGLSLSSIRLEPTKYKDKDAIEVYITDFNNKEYMMGHVPKDKVDEVLNFMENIEKHPEYKLKADSYITGGKFKSVQYDTEKDKDVIVNDELSYGINVKLDLFE